MEFWLIFLLLCHTVESGFIGSTDINHGLFQLIQIPSGISRVVFSAIPPNSTFIVIQLHSPFNAVLASTVPSFDYAASQISEHCGLVAKLAPNSSDSTLYIYSSHERNLTGWARADAYSSEYPIPGGNGRFMSSGYATASLMTVIADLPSNINSQNGSHTSLRHWTSVLKFDAAVPPKFSSMHNANSPSNHTTDYSMTYNLYSTPLVNAGGFCNGYKNPTPMDVAYTLESMISPGVTRGSLIYSFSLSNEILDSNEKIEIPLARRPGTAFVLTLVVEYSRDHPPVRIAYTPVVLYGCRAPKPSKNYLGTAYLVNNYSTQLSCGILLPDSPNMYFLISVILLASLIYGCACNLLIWSRCAASVMLVASFFGTLLYFRYSYPTSDAMLILALSVLFPAGVALLCFIALWCICVRPTLQYQRLFGRGPLLRVFHRDQTYEPSGFTGPWNVNSSNEAVSVTRLLYDQHIAASSDVSCSIAEPHSTCDVLPASTADSNPAHEMASEEPRLVSTSVLSDCPACVNNCFPALSESKRSNKVLSLKPRRLARLTPVLPAAALVVLSLSVLIDETLPMKESKASYLAFIILTTVLVMCPLCIFKNLAFGLSTALVGVYLGLSCACLFFVKNAMLPFLLIEPFLRLTWMEYRLDVLRIEAFGQYDILLVVAWIAGTLALSLLTLFLVRLQDARELSEAQLCRPILSVGRTIDLTSNGGNNAGIPSWNSDSTLPMRNALLVESSDVVYGVTGGASVQPEGDSAGFHGSANTQRGLSERTHLLTNASRAYGSLSSNAPSMLVPLSRVQLAAKIRPSRI